MTDAEDRFWSKVRIGDECWNWTAHKTRKGYGKLTIAGRAQLAHRVSWQFANGAIPPGMFVCHRCDNPACVRPSHLFLGTNADNVDDMVAKNRHAHGHAHYSRLRPDRLARGTRSGRAKLADAQVMEIRARLASGETQAALARAYNVGRSTIRAIATGRTWIHVAAPATEGGGSV